MSTGYRTDADLAAAVRQDDPTAAAELLARHAGLVRSIVSALDAPAWIGRDDLLQVARLALLRAARTWNPASPTRAKLTTYATVCVRRAVVREMTRARHRPLPQSAEPDAPEHLPAAPADASALPAVDPDRLPALLAALTPRQRLAVEHRYGLAGRIPARTWAALADRLRVTEGQARRLHDAAIEQLRAALDGRSA